MSGRVKFEEIEAELASERARAKAQDGQRTRCAVRFGHGALSTRTVPCKDCGVGVQLSLYADIVVEQSAALLAKLGEPPLEDGELTRCDACSADWRTRREAASREVIQRATAIIRSRRRTPGELEWLERHGYHDSVAAIREAAAEKTTGKARGRRRVDEDDE